MCAVPNMPVFCSSLNPCFPGMLLVYFLNDFDIHYYYYYYYYYSMSIIAALLSRFSAACAIDLEIPCQASSIMKVFHVCCKGNVPRLVKHVAFENV